MNTIRFWLVVLLMMAYITACSAGPSTSSPRNPSQTPDSLPSLQLSPTLEPTVAQTPFPSLTPIVVEDVGQTVQTIRLPKQGYRFPAFGAGAVWVPSRVSGRNVLMRVDPATRQVVAEIAVDKAQVWDIFAVAAEGDVIWSTAVNEQAVVRIDAHTNQIVDRIPIQAQPDAIALQGNTLWVAHESGNEVLRLDTETKQIVARVPVADPDSIAIGNDSIWVVGNHAENLIRIDPTTNSIVATISLGTAPDSDGQVAFGEGGVWVSRYSSETVARVDPETNQVIATIEMGIPVINVEAGAGAIWAVVGEFEGCQESGVVRIDPRTNTVVGLIPVRCAEDMVLSPEGLWVTSHKYPEITLVEPEE